MNQIELNINYYAQNQIDIEALFNWFDSLNKTDKSATLNQLYWYIINVKPTEYELQIAIVNSKLKITYTPIVLIQKEQINISVPKILNLPLDEWRKSFTLLIELFKIADQRRRLEDCRGNCTHEWHNINDTPINPIQKAR